MREVPGVRWLVRASPPPLSDDGLHVWLIPCGETGAASLPPLSLLSRAERARAERLRQEHHKTRYIRAHAGLRRVLARYLNQAPQRIRYDYGSAGKPSLPAGPEFNLTTSGDLALVAVCRDRPVGIDCEPLRPHTGLEAIARRMFPAAESAALAAAPQTEKLLRFCLSWTALEAAVKADGRGLGRSRVEPPMPKLDVAHFAPEPGFIAAVARADLPPLRAWSMLRLP
jgi:4'-phosphopantetheinyl transferase